MCFWNWFVTHEETINQTLTRHEIRSRKSVWEKMDLWLFFHTHPSIARQHDKDIRTVTTTDGFIVNPMRNMFRSDSRSSNSPPNSPSHHATNDIRESLEIVIG
jgi:hypothetical protein